MSVGWEDAWETEGSSQGAYFFLPVCSSASSLHPRDGTETLRAPKSAASPVMRLESGLLSELKSKWASLLTPGCFPAAPHR